ncbi:amino acid adenylation domain-containing protein [Streptomyces sp. NPDC017936]|uniref:amino acid adenylation domain-containing protein n=1 Tax=Streptomyces sp. NPDC017936 TaxID=3365016 RepID=UPI0037924044
MQTSPKTLTADQLIRLRVDLHPDATAIECGEQTLTYRGLWQQAGDLATRIQQAEGFEPGCLIGVLHRRGIRCVVAQLAAWRAGAAYLPLDPDLPDGRIASVLVDAAPTAVLASADLFGRLPSSVAAIDSAVGDPMREPAPSSAALAYVIYTSGSTGTPKGVEVGHASLVNLLQWHRETYATGPGTRVGALAGLGFDASVWETWAALAAGATLLLPERSPGADIEAVADFLRAGAVEQCFLSTPLAEELLRLESPPDTLRVLLTGGDRLRVRPSPSFPATVHNHYGPTEATVVTTASHDLRGDHLPDRPPVIGTPIPGALVRLVDPAGDEVNVPGVAGELLIGGTVLSTGYRNDPALTSKKFLGTDDAARWYISGDVCRWTENGELEFVERRDRQMSVRGNRIEPVEIEHAVLAVPEVQQCAVVLRDDGAGGTLVAFCTGGVDERTVHEALADRLPPYMVPSRIRVLDALPLTPNGKIDRAALLLLSAPEESAEPARRQFPPGSAEQVIAEIWAELLAGTEPRPGDNFFELGGHSLLAARMIGEVRKRLSIQIGLQAVFDFPVLAELAARVDELSRTGG